MSEAVMPIAGGMEIPLRFALLGVGNIVPEQVFHHGAPQEEKSQWGQFEEYSQSIAAVAKSLGDGIERNSVAVGSSCPAKESSVFDRMSASDVEYVRTVEPSPQSVKAVASSSVPTVEKPQSGAIESSRVEKPNIAEAVEVKVSEKPVVKAVEPSRVPTVEKPQTGARDVFVREEQFEVTFHLTFAHEIFATNLFFTRLMSTHTASRISYE